MQKCSCNKCDNPIQIEYACEILICKECYTNGNQDFTWNQN